MRSQASRGVLTALPTCRLRPYPTTTAPHSRALEITHASRLRRKLCGERHERLIVNVWGVGFRLIDGPLRRSEQPSAVR
jgi:hypothetical protein